MAMLKKVAVAVAEVMMTPLALVQGGHLGVVTEKVVGEDMTMMIPQAVAAAVTALRAGEFRQPDAGLIGPRPK
jgi:hypothetical protein